MPVDYDDTAKQMVELLNHNYNTIDPRRQTVPLELVQPGFIGVHRLLDDNRTVKKVSDTIAERIVILGGEPNGILQHVAK